MDSTGRLDGRSCVDVGIIFGKAIVEQFLLFEYQGVPSSQVDLAYVLVMADITESTRIFDTGESDLDWGDTILAPQIHSTEKIL